MWLYVYVCIWLGNSLSDVFRFQLSCGCYICRSNLFGRHPFCWKHCLIFYKLFLKWSCIFYLIVPNNLLWRTWDKYTIIYTFLSEIVLLYDLIFIGILNFPNSGRPFKHIIDKIIVLWVCRAFHSSHYQNEGIYRCNQCCLFIGIRNFEMHTEIT